MAEVKTQNDLDFERKHEELSLIHISLEQPDDGLGQQAEHQAVHIGDAGGALPDEGF